MENYDLHTSVCKHAVTRIKRFLKHLCKNIPSGIENKGF